MVPAPSDCMALSSVFQQFIGAFYRHFFIVTFIACFYRLSLAFSILFIAYKHIIAVNYLLDCISETSRPSVSSLYFFLSPHSQTTITFHPASRSNSLFRLSRATLPRILGSQYSGLEDGQTKRGQSCLCQKHPFTKITAWYLGRTMSGQPGKLRTFLR